MPEPRVLCDGLTFGESARWHDGRLWFADWGTGEIVAVDLDGRREVMHRVAGFPFSIDWLPDGRLLVVSSRLDRDEGGGSLVPHADVAALAPGWNEIVVDGRGNTYINQAGFDLMSGAPPTSGTVALVSPEGTVREVADDVWFPNGMAVTADGTTLIVAESYRNRLTAFAIADDGRLRDRRVWAELGTDVPDGICVDAEGAVWYADVPNRHCVRVREGGQVLQTIELDRGCFSCALGGPDGRTLFIVATEWRGPQAMFEGKPTGRVVTVDVAVPHAGHP
ncbi:MAG: SMP-30/gluconolactonase/LRE family protein [Jatrophihabitans sp.]|uniref:SMP-30/gluconolactonase/LRE family protein n=1 Tax=Jatrophihabitans sp. TaxID=1932789 RepID=UPI003912540E